MLKDPRDYQIGFLSLFLTLGISTRDWSFKPSAMAIVICSCLVTQWILTVLWPNLQLSHKNGAKQDPPLPEGKRVGVKAASWCSIPCWKSALITSLSLCLLLRANHVSTLILASGAAIGSKFLFKVNDKHFFNPANVGIVTVLLLTRDAWVSPGQWGTDGWCVLVFIGAAGIILGKVGRWDTSVIFLGCYACLEAVRNQWLGWSWDVWAHHLISGSLWVFALFMLTDPRSIPDARIGRVIWAMGIAALTFVLRYCFFIPTGMFWSLFALAPFTVLLDHLWSTPRFSWLMPAAPQEVQGEDPQMRDLQTGELPTVA